MLGNYEVCGRKFRPQIFLQKTGIQLEFFQSGVFICWRLGEVLTDIVMPDLETSETESSLEINFLIGKLKHSVKRVKKQNDDK